jgi:hypothetical protein
MAEDARYVESRKRFHAAIELIGRSGAKSLEVGYHPLYDAAGNELDEAVTPAKRYRWWAKAQWKGAVLAVDDHPGPNVAVEALAERVRRGATCAHCGRLIAWGSRRRRYCWWREIGGRWTPGCSSAERKS